MKIHQVKLLLLFSIINVSGCASFRPYQLGVVSPREEAERITRAINQKEEYTGGDETIRSLINGLNNKDAAKLRQSGMEKLALLIEQAKKNQLLDRLNLFSVAFPTINGVLIDWMTVFLRQGSVENCCLRDQFLIKMPLNQDLDGNLSGEQMRDKYGALNYSLYQVNVASGEVKSAWVFNLTRADLKTMTLLLSRLFKGEKTGLQVIYDTAFGLRIKLTNLKAEVPIKEHYGTWLLADVADQYGNHNGVATPWEYSKFLKDLLLMIALSEENLSAEIVNYLAKDGLTKEKASQWIDKLKPLVINTSQAEPAEPEKPRRIPNQSETRINY